MTPLEAARKNLLTVFDASEPSDQDFLDGLERLIDAKIAKLAEKLEPKRPTMKQGKAPKRK